MNIKNKIISAICSLSMVATMCVATVANAEGNPTIELKATQSGENIKLDVVTNLSKASGFGISINVSGLTIEEKSDASADFKSGFAMSTAATTTSTIKMTGIGMSEADLTDGILGSFSVKVGSVLTDNAVFTITGANIDTAKVAYKTETATLDLAKESTTVYVPVTVKNITADDGAVYVGKAAALSAELDDAAKLGDRVVTWKTNDSDKYTITVDPTDSTKATLTATVAGKVTVTATVDNNGTSSEKSIEFEATVKPEPTAYTVTATAVNTANGTTVTVKPDAEYTGTREAFDIVAQFYTEDGTAAGWVKVSDIAALNSGEYSVNLNAQNAAKVSVTVYKADTNTVIGKN